MTRVLGATPPAVAPGVGVVLVPQPAGAAAEPGPAGGAGRATAQVNRHNANIRYVNKAQRAISVNEVSFWLPFASTPGLVSSGFSPWRMTRTWVLGATPPAVAPGVGLVLGATLPAVAPGVGVMRVPQPASMANAASATIVAIVRSTARRVGDTGALVLSGTFLSEGVRVVCRAGPVAARARPRAPRAGADMSAAARPARAWPAGAGGPPGARPDRRTRCASTGVPPIVHTAAVGFAFARCAAGWSPRSTGRRWAPSCPTATPPWPGTRRSRVVPRSGPRGSLRRPGRA